MASSKSRIPGEVGKSVSVKIRWDGARLVFVRLGSSQKRWQSINENAVWAEGFATSCGGRAEMLPWRSASRRRGTPERGSCLVRIAGWGFPIGAFPAAFGMLLCTHPASAELAGRARNAFCGGKVWPSPELQSRSVRRHGHGVFQPSEFTVFPARGADVPRRLL
jgi:hypothetical protein